MASVAGAAPGHGAPPYHPPVLSVRHYLAGRVVEGIDPSQVSELRTESDSVVWVDGVDVSEEELLLLADEFGLHHLAVEDARKHGQRPKLEHYTTHAFLVGYSADLAEIDVWIGPDWLITVRGRGRRGEVWDHTPALALYERATLDDPDVGKAVWAVLDVLVDEYFGALDRSEDVLEHLEDRVFAEDGTDEREVQRDLFEIRRHLLEFRRTIVPMRDVVAGLLRREVPSVRGEALVLLQDVLDHVLRVIDQTDAQRELVGNAVDAHLAIISNNINQVMKTMTSWGAILFSASLIAGIYGMNFRHMPELGWALGYPFALGTMAAVTFVLWRWFRKRGWI
jgi:magnesium transporter